LAKIAFTSHLRDVGPGELTEYPGQTLAELLEAVSADHPRVRNYILDDQGRVRKHVAIFIDGVMRPRETALALRVTDASDVYVLQALSGG
jgi:molybdopterin synthase sulfur carrier subunit